MHRYLASSLLALAVSACGPVDPDDTTTAASTAATSEGPTTGASSTGTTGGATHDVSSTVAPTSTGTTTDTTDATTTGAHDCGGMLSCSGAEVCVLPCCGGPAPGCSDVDGRGNCQGDDMPVPARQCQFGGCTGPLCCPPVGCTPDPPFCVAPAQLTCAGGTCSIDSCSGTLGGNQLQCNCA